jgi:effector-binding domain-containing protein
VTTTSQLESMEVTVPQSLLAQLERTSSNMGDLGPDMSAAFGALYAAIARAGITPSGPPRAIYTAWGPNEVRFTVALPIDRAPAVVPEGITVAASPERTALRFVHHGSYRELRATYGRIEAWLRERGGIKRPDDWARYAPMWEEYMNDPSTTPEADLVTRIYLTLP